ncbi:unnamed protein product [Discosporangium mesarthrocarpum]
MLSRVVSRQITNVLKRKMPANVTWVGMGKCTLGPTPPKIRYITAQNVSSIEHRQATLRSNSVIDRVLEEVSTPGTNVTAENIVYAEAGVDWTSTRSKISIKLGEPIQRRNWWSVRSFVPSYRVKVCDLGVQAKVIFALHFGEGRPFVQRIWLSFAEPPVTHMSLEALTGMDLANLPVLRKHMRNLVLRCLTPLTEPR